MNYELLTAVGLTVVYAAAGFLGALTERVERSSAIRLWIGALFCFALDEANAAAAILYGEHGIFRHFAWVMLMGGGLFGLAGTLRLLGKPILLVVKLAILVSLVFLVLGFLLGPGSIAITVLVFGVTAVAMSWAGVLILRARAETGVGRWVAGSAFVAAGCYAAAWPFLRMLALVRQLEFFFDLTVTLWATAGVFLLHFERAREKIKALAQQEIELREKLERSERLDALGRLAGGVAHDFNNVLTTIIHGSELVLRQIEDRPRAAENLRLVLDAAQGAAQFTRQLLSIGRRRMPDRKPVSLSDAVNSALRMVRPNVPGNVKLEHALPESSWCVLSGEGQIEQVVVNLALNALDAMPNGGRLEIIAAHDPPSSTLTLRVADTGQGMSKETLQHIFEPFFSTKSARGGTGLGLAAVYAIVKQLEGHIEAESSFGSGTVFKVTLPTCPQGADQTPFKRL